MVVMCEVWHSLKALANIEAAPVELEPYAECLNLCELISSRILSTDHAVRDFPIEQGDVVAGGASRASAKT